MFIPIRELAEELDISFHFLTKIMQVLTEARIMESFRGPNGGIGLARKAEEISLLEIVAAIDGMDMFEQCALGLPGCSEETPCPLHGGWAKRRADIKKMLGKTTLATLVSNIIANTHRKRKQ